MKIARSLFLLIALFLLVGCETTSVMPIRGGSSSFFQIESDERRLWNRSEEEQKKLERSDLLYRDEELVLYVNDIAKRLYPADVHQQVAFRVVILKNPLLNAFSYPNGVVYVHSGMIARMENEAELATLLAHEMTHVTHRHALQQMRDLKNKAAFMATFNVITSAAGAWGSIASLLGQVGALAAVQGYSRELETEADTEGFGLVVAAQYDPAETGKLFLRLKEDVEERKIDEPFFFGSHPRLQERIENYEKLQTLHPGKGGMKNEEIFSQKTFALLLIDADQNISAGNYKIAQREAEKYLSRNPDDAHVHFLLGEVCRQRNEQGDVDRAMDFYRKSVGKDPAYATSYKALGLLHLKKGEKPQAKEHLQRYLILSPQAQDRAYILEYLKQCE
ncbi:Tetratricopeptide repeat-containing protein [Syntrophus gentianae]|uniref:Tetratricopeptide repeat-containing protein n=1 Tax=Syntrophus gentianae TaxID=43775 RepID=A0A1H8A495_9BACT|nr:M48 family metallopeptidase [Syntrophus gentianae]SEM65383.1 Tetratricopeptide repeat-containing protein [Syntrophus gentianae]